MRKMIARTIFIGILMVCIFVTGHILRPIGTDSSVNAIRTFRSMPEDSFDVIAYGSSHCWRGFSSIAFQEKYGVSCYNYGANWQRFNTTWLFFKDSLKTQSPEVVFIETFNVRKLLSNTDVNGEIFYTRELSWSKDKGKYLRQCLGSAKKHLERYLGYFIPLVMDHTNWASLTADSFTINSDTKDLADTLGFVDSNGVRPIEIAYTKDNDKDMPKRCIKLLDDIVETCKEEQIDLVFYTAPCQARYSAASFMEKYAAENDCHYVNLFEHMEKARIDTQTDFADKRHLNTSGAVKVADFLGRFLIKKGIMPE